MMFEHMGVLSAEAPRVEPGFTRNGSVFINQSENAGGRDFIVLVEEGICSDGLNIGPVASARRACINPDISRCEHQLFSLLGTVIRLELGEDAILTFVSEFEPVLTAVRRTDSP